MKPKDALTEQEIQTGLGYLIKDGVASQAMGILTDAVKQMISFPMSMVRDITVRMMPNGDKQKN